MMKLSNRASHPVSLVCLILNLLFWLSLPVDPRVSRASHTSSGDDDDDDDE